MKVRVFGFLVVVFAFFGMFSLFGEDFWEGNAVVVRSGEMDKPGLYALSDSFPKYSKIVVKNLSNGKEVTVTVLDRTRGVTNVFLLLSREAAEKIGIKYGSIAHVRVSLSREPGIVTAGMPGDLPYNPDPDINPAVNIPEEKLVSKTPVKSLVKQGIKSEELREKTISPSKSKVKGKVESTEPSEEKPVVKEIKKPTKKQLAEEEPFEELVKKRPEGLLFKAPTKPERVVVIERPIEKPPVSGERKEKLEIATLPKSESEGSELPALENLNIPSRGKKVSGLEPSVEFPGVEEPKTELVTGKSSGKEKKSELKIEKKPMEPGKGKEENESKREVAKPSAEKPTPRGGEVVLKLEPTGPKPPPPIAGKTLLKEEEAKGRAMKKESTRVSPEKSISKKSKPERSEITEKLPKGAYFLQIAAYYSETLANKLVSRLSNSYPVTILSTRRNDKTLYKVLVGPLNRDESGALLYWFRSKGYKDSFIKTP